MSGLACLSADCEDRLSGDRPLRYLAWEEPDRGSVALPVDPKQLEQLGREHHLAILTALALTDTDDLSLAVDICHPQVGELGNPQPGGIDNHQDGAVFEVAGCFEHCCHFGGTTDSFCSCRGYGICSISQSR